MTASELRGEPALVLDAIKVGLVMLATFGLPLSGDLQTWILAALVAGFGLVKGFSTHPFPVTAVTDLIQAVGVLAIGLGTPLTNDQLAVVITFASAVLVAIQRAQISPRSTARTERTAV